MEQHHQHVSGTGYTYDYYGRFGRYYYRYQDIYYVPQAIREYQVFHVETVVYELGGGQRRNYGPWSFGTGRDGRSYICVVAEQVQRWVG